MIPFTKPNIEELVSREIVLSDLKFWTNKGTIMTPNNIDYTFVYRVLGDVIGDITIDPEKLRYFRGNMFHYKIGENAGRLINKHDGNGRKNSEYAELSEILDYVAISRVFQER